VIDLLSEAGARAWLEGVKRSVRDDFVNDGELPAGAVLIATRDERNGKKLPNGGCIYVGVMPSILNDHGAYGQKDQLASYLRRMARKVDAVGFAFWSEAWAVHDTTDLPATGSFEHVPGRREIVMLNVQHKALGEDTRSFAAVIQERAGGRRVLRLWSPEGRSRGRFSGVLRTAKEDAQIERMIPVLLAMGEHLTPEQRRYHLDNVLHRLIADGESKEEAEWKMRAFTEIIREHGQAVAELPSDRPVPPASADPIRLVNLNEAEPIVGRGKA